MKALALAALLCAAPSLAGAEAYSSGFNPRFGTAPSNPDQPDYRPPGRPRNQYEFLIGVDVNRDPDQGEEEPEGPPRPPHRPDRPRH